MTVLRKMDPWAPPLALMALIFFFSAQSGLDSGLGLIDHIGRKLIHASEYALLCFLWWRTLRTVMDRMRALPVAFAISVLYAASDEYHQTLTPGRHGTPVDVLIDACGAGVLALLVYRSQRVKAVP